MFGILICVFGFIIGSLILFWIIRSAINDSNLNTHLQELKNELVELKQELKSLKK
ncbi:hypothetical protein SAMN05443246_4023 [Paenibacillus sp. GP183]|jgi:uncharacterized membrane-anchored protein YhcB (DUF1043 family)|nr:hypothetical protein SAMN05443246_4023 [Paenibacillus sp. GP183]